MATPRSGVLRGAEEQHHRSPAPPAGGKRVSFLFHELLRPKEREQDGGGRQRLKAKASFLPDDQEPQALLLSEKQGRTRKLWHRAPKGELQPPFQEAQRKRQGEGARL